MSTVPYTYCVVRYRHDPATGEMLNIGVILSAPTANYLDARLDHHYERLSEAFRSFDGEHYRRTLRQFLALLDVLRERVNAQELFDAWDIPGSVKSVAEYIWPDIDLSFQISEAMAGITDGAHDTLELLFHRMVTSQYARPRLERRTDDEVWTIYQEPLARRKVVRKLRHTVLTTPEVELKFDYAFQNERWHVLQPMSMDYVKKESIQNKATKWLGNAVALESNKELKKLYILLGPPMLESYRSAYVKAKNLLHKIPIEHELIEEDAAEHFAAYIEDFMKKHNVEENL
jgi:hypothetical protein